MINSEDLHALATLLVVRHGTVAADYAGHTISELEASGETERAATWRALKSFVEDMLAGRLDSNARFSVH